METQKKTVQLRIGVGNESIFNFHSGTMKMDYLIGEFEKYKNYEIVDMELKYIPNRGRKTIKVFTLTLEKRLSNINES